MSSIKVSTFYNRVKSIGAYSIEKEGRIVDSGEKTFRLQEGNLKKGSLVVIEKALRIVKLVCKHEDILYIEVQNQHLCSWLSGLEEKKGYEAELDKVFSTLQGIDCRYKFLFVPSNSASKLVEKGIEENNGCVSFSDAMKDL